MNELNDLSAEPAITEAEPVRHEAQMPDAVPLEETAPQPRQWRTIVIGFAALAAFLTAAPSAVTRGIQTFLGLHQTAVARGRTIWGWVHHNERPLSALGMVAGFGFDNYSYRRIDLPNTQALFIAYLALSASSIALLHFFSRRAGEGKAMPRWHSLLPVATQFALGGLWSAFLVFYSRGSVLTASWPFLLVLISILIGNEFFKNYHSKLAFTSILFFFALYSYCIVTMPILTGHIGMLTFLASGFAAAALFYVFARALRKIGPEQWLSTRNTVALGAAAVFAVLNLFYFTDILPPLPLALADSGVYQSVSKTAKGYVAGAETQKWTVRFGGTPVMHVTAGQSLSVYSAVFAPIRLSAHITHLWQRYDAASGEWRTVSKVTYEIHGGRDGGFRGYTIHHNIEPGEWRVDVDTADGRTIGRIRFNVERATEPAATAQQKLG